MSHSTGMARVLVIVVLLTVPAVWPTAPSNADELTDQWGAGLETGIVKLVEGSWDYSSVDQFFGLSVSRGLSMNWNLQGSLFYGYTRPGAAQRSENVGGSFDSSAPLYTTLLQPAVKLQYRIAPESVVCPWLGFGAGVTRWKTIDMRGQDVGL